MRRFDIFAAVVAIAGVALAVETRMAGHVLRYQLAGFVAAGALALPGLTILLLRDRARRFWRRLLFAFVPLLVLLVLVELAMRMFGPAPIPPGVLLEDDRLGHVVAPGSAGTDAWGFRNEAVPAKVDALFLGDSQTWGFFLQPSQTLAAQFAQQTGRSSYQMANGGYGPVHYRELLRRGLSLRPELVVIGFYFGNDLIDATHGAGLVSGADLRASNRQYPVPKNPEIEGPWSPNWTMGFVDWLQSESRLCGWAGEVVKSRLRGASFLDDEPGAVRWSRGSVATVLLPRYRMGPVDLDNPDIADGVRITRRCLADIAAECEAAHARCLVLAIPTKEYCYAEWQPGLLERSPQLDALHAAEVTVRERVFAACADADLEVIDLAPICIAALAADTPFWAHNGDGHLNMAGHLAAAEEVIARWSRK